MKNILQSTSLISLITFVSASGAFASTFTYTLAEITPFASNHTSSSATALNDNGSVLVSSSGNGTGFTNFLWNDGTATEITLPSGASATIRGLNNQETSATTISTNTGPSQAATTTNGVTTLLPRLSEDTARTDATDINNSGQVVGSDSSGAALTWINGSVERLAEFSNIPNAESYTALAINDHNQIVGQATLKNVGSPFPSTRHDAVMWDNGQITNLGADPIITGISRAQDINNLGQVVGYSETEIGIHATLWHDGDAVVIGDPSIASGNFPGPQSSAQAINDLGQVVGFAQSNNGSFGFIWDGANGFQNLEDLIDPSLGWSFDAAYDINNLGQITGWGTNAQGQSRAFLLTPENSVLPAPIPLPAGLPLMLGAMASFLALRRHKTRNR